MIQLKGVPLRNDKLMLKTMFSVIVRICFGPLLEGIKGISTANGAIGVTVTCDISIIYSLAQLSKTTTLECISVAILTIDHFKF